MNKPSDRLESFDHNMEAYNFAIDIQKQRIQAELKWLDDNYDNIDALKYYFLSIMNFNNQLQYALTNLGFEIYDIDSEKVDLNKDGYYDFEILPIDNEFKLKKGDIISRDGHIHIYLSDNENFGWGKVNNIYPQKSLTYIDPITNSIICNGESFDRVYRYIGEK